MTEAAHSKYSASGFEAALRCPGKPVMERGLPDSSSVYADEGTAAHQVLSWAIENKRPARAYLGRRIPVGMRTFEVDEDMATHVQTALDAVHVLAASADLLLSEQRVCYADYLGVPEAEAWGTADVIAMGGPELIVADLKYGMGVEVDPEDNPQLMLYALGALGLVRLIGHEPERVRMVILQPRLKSEPAEWTCSVAELERWGYHDGAAAVLAMREAASGVPEWHETPHWQAVFLQPNAKSCRFCKAKPTCPAARAEVTRTVFEVVPASPDEFESLAPAEKAKHSTGDWLARVLDKADMIEEYVKAVRAEVERRLHTGETVPGYKLVTGKRGNRAWVDEAEAQKTFGALPEAELYEPRKLRSPAQLEKTLKKAWPVLHARLPALVTQSDGKPHAAPVSDSRPALTVAPITDEFPTVSIIESLT